MLKRYYKNGISLGHWFFLFLLSRCRRSYKYIFLGWLVLDILMITTPVMTNGAGGLVPCGSIDNMCQWSHLITLINKVIEFLIFTLGIPLATIVVIVSGVKLVWNPNSSTAQSVWESRLRIALFGLVVMLTAWLIVKAVIFGLVGPDNYDLKDLFSN